VSSYLPEMFFDRGIMGLRLTRGDEKRLLSSHYPPLKRRALLCHPERSRRICSSIFRTPTNLSSRPKRTRISCHAALERTACAPFRKERRMDFAEATNLHRKSGVAKWRDLLFRGPLLEMFFDREVMGLRPTQGDENGGDCRVRSSGVAHFDHLIWPTWVVVLCIIVPVLASWVLIYILFRRRGRG
jgi:hypothetical protein